ncbi:MAG: large conductance mechanosensitive channel protein MscL [Bacteriovorax sp.]
MLKEFREFAVKGNMIDLAIGVIIGAAFGSIVKSLVDDVIMPPIGMLIGNVDFNNIFFVLREGITIHGPYDTLADALKAGAVVIKVGVFLNTVINFIIIAFCIFIMIKQLQRFKKKDAATAVVAPEVQLLTEIRDLLKK